MKNICYLFFSKQRYNKSRAQILSYIQSGSECPADCKVVQASSAYYEHFDVMYLFEYLVSEYSADYLIGIAPGTSLSHLMIKYGSDVEFFLCVPNASFITPEMAQAAFEVRKSKWVPYSFDEKERIRGEQKRIRDRLDDLLVEFKQ